MAGVDYTNRKTGLPDPTNERLYKLFEGVDKVIFKDGGVMQGQAMTNDIVLVISQENEVQQLKELLQIDEASAGGYCMCLGSYAIELYAGMQIKAAIGFHHGYSIRYDNWNGDAILVQNEQLLQFIAKLGLAKPLEEWNEDELRREQGRMADEKWLDQAPNCFSRYWDEMNDFDYSYLPLLSADLDDEIPDKEQQIIALLQTFGVTSGCWRGYPMYEGVPEKLLGNFDIGAITSAYLNSDKDDTIRKGLGRFLCSYEPEKKGIKWLKDIPQIIIDDLQECFRSLNEQEGIEEMAKLERAKNNG